MNDVGPTWVVISGECGYVSNVWYGNTDTARYSHCVRGKRRVAFCGCGEKRAKCSSISTRTIEKFA